LTPGTTVRSGGTVELTGASADMMGGVRLLGQVESSRISANAGYGATTVGDLRGGGGTDSRAAVTRFLGLPADLPDGRMPDTGYDMRFGFGNVVVRAGASGIVSGSYVMQTQTGVSRYDRLAGGQGLFASGFTPQRLDLGLLRYEGSAGRWLDRWSATVSINRQEDGRFEQARPSSRLDRQSSVTTAYGYQLQGFRFYGGRHQLLAGVEAYDERQSAERTLVEPSGAISAARPDVPNGTTYLTMGGFVQQVSEVWRDRLLLRGGLRYSRFRFATTADPTVGVVDDRVVADAVTFQVGAVAMVAPFLNVTANVSRGFRAGNSADLGGIGLTGGGGFEISPGRAVGLDAFVGSNEGATAVSTGQRVGALAPEIADTFELGIKLHDGPVSGSVSVYDVELRDAIQRRTIIVSSPAVGTNIAGFEVVRQDEAGRIYVAEDARPIVTRVNLSRARVVGIDAEASLALGLHWKAAGYFSMSNGSADDGEYLRRMPPPIGGFSLRWSDTGRHLWAEGVMGFARRQTRLNSGDLGDARIGASRSASSIAGFFNGPAVDQGLVSGGTLISTGETLAQVQARVLAGQPSSPLFLSTPGFVTIGFRAGWQPTPTIGVTVIGENLSDRNFRWHGSGVDAPGRSVQARIRYHFWK
jgi:outer membrane receptor protein involved in Fe transport